VADLMAHTGMKRNAIRSLLMEFDAAGLIESQRPRVHQNRGATTRRYWRAR
jgi:transcription initiation factor IIE alpha subunit